VLCSKHRVGPKGTEICPWLISLEQLNAGILYSVERWRGVLHLFYIEAHSGSDRKSQRGRGNHRLSSGSPRRT
jgi:hypothetical protein